MFRTKIEQPQNAFQLNYQSKTLTVGSCFSESIGDRLELSKFNTQVNPFGTIFNPLSIFELLELSLERSEVLEQATLKRDGYYLNYKFHSSFRAKTKETLHKRIEKSLTQTGNYLKNADLIFITLGTAWVYEQKKTDLLVANCHKIPQKEFNRRLLGVEETIATFFNLKELINQYNPKVQFIFTVSPVRHTRDSLRLNSVSKAVLRMAAHYLEDMSPDIHYFPAYEILMDDLRDYRFFEKDMVHPNEQAIDYVWDYFKSNHLTKKSIEVLEKWDKIRASINHKPFNPKSGAHKKFLEKTLHELKELQKELPLSNEINQLQQQLG